MPSIVSHINVTVQWRAQTSRGAGAKRCYEGTIVDQGWGVGVVGLWVWSPLASGGRFGKNLTFFIYIYIRINDFIMILCLFCKLFEHYSQTNFPIIKTKPYKVNKI